MDVAVSKNKVPVRLTRKGGTIFQQGIRKSQITIMKYLKQYKIHYVFMKVLEMNILQ